MGRWQVVLVLEVLLHILHRDHWSAEQGERRKQNHKDHW
jgi:hypothetical protein